MRGLIVCSETIGNQYLYFFSSTSRNYFAGDRWNVGFGILQPHFIFFPGFLISKPVPHLQKIRKIHPETPPDKFRIIHGRFLRPEFLQRQQKTGIIDRNFAGHNGIIMIQHKTGIFQHGFSHLFPSSIQKKTKPVKKKRDNAFARVVPEKAGESDFSYSR